MRRSPPGWFPRRGEVYWASLDKRRPAVVLSVDALNRHALDVCVVPLTTVSRRQFSLRIHILARESGLPGDSWAKCDQVTTLDKSFLLCPPVGRLSNETLSRIAEAVGVTLGLVET